MEIETAAHSVDVWGHDLVGTSVLAMVTMWDAMKVVL